MKPFKSGCGFLAVLFLAGSFSGCGEYLEYIPKEAPARENYVPEISNVLLNIINSRENLEADAFEIDSKSLEKLITLRTPNGIRINLRYRELGVSLIEALKTSRDEEVLEKLFELAQWSDVSRLRSEALVMLGSFSDPKDLRYFTSSLTEETDVGLRLAVIEALQLWKRDGGLAILKNMTGPPWSEFVQVYAAQAVLAYGDETGMAVLVDKLDSKSWIVKAMAAQYIGDYGSPDLLDRILREFDKENRNDFVQVELAVCALKLLSRKEKDVAYTPYKKGWKDNEAVAYTVGPDNVVEMAPLVIIPPRLYIPEEQAVAQSINNKLILIIENRTESELTETEQADPNLEDLYKMVTPKGFALQNRYSSLSILLIQGLAGAHDKFLESQLIKIVGDTRNPAAQASAILALAYGKKEGNIIYVQDGLDSNNSDVRFGAMEAALAGRYRRLIPNLLDKAYNDPIPAFRVYAMGLLCAFGERTGLDLLRNNVDNLDWPARAMTFWYLGRYGEPADYQLVLSRLQTETNSFVLSEMSLAASRLAPLQN